MRQSRPDPGLGLSHFQYERGVLGRAEWREVRDHLVLPRLALTRRGVQLDVTLVHNTQPIL